MATPTWQPGTLYIPGSLVKPRSSATVTQSEPLNADFEGGNTGWTLGSGFSIGQFGGLSAFNGTWSLKYDLNDPAVQVSLNDNVVPVTPGLAITASCQIQQGASSRGQAGGQVLLHWYDSGMTLIREDLGSLVNSGSGGQWHQSQVSALAPAGAAFAQVGIGMFRLSGSSPVFADVVIWNYTYSGPPEGFIYKAVQALSGYSASSEPIWPTVLGNTVVDNEVTWEAVLTSRVVYEAHPILKSGDTEPDFPSDIGGTVADNTIIWEATARQITDPKCPHSPIVVTAASKIFAADGDIIPYSATTNPLDWSTRDDAGFLPFGLQKYGTQPITGMGLYRSNLVAFNVTGAQMWQIDEDPSNNALLDAVPVGCRYHKSIQPVMNDFAFLTDVGIRNFGIAAASTNLQAGDFAKAIDPLVKAAIRQGFTPIGLFFPGTGQYMLFFGAEAYVLTWNGTSSRNVSRSRYTFPSAIENWTILDGALYFRTGDTVWRFDEQIPIDDSMFIVPRSRLVVGNGAENGGPAARFGYLGPFIESESQFGSMHSANYSGRPLGPNADVGAMFTDLDGLDPRLILVLNLSTTADPLEQDFFGTLTVLADDLETALITLQSDDADFYTVEEFFDAEPVAGAPNQRVWVWYLDDASPLDDLADETIYAQLTGNDADTAFYIDGAEFEGYIAWPYLEMQGLGNDTMLHGFDLVGSGEVAVSFGYNQQNFDHATTPYTVQAETISGMPVAMPIKAPSVQLRLTFSGAQFWSWNAARLYDSPVNT